MLYGSYARGDWVDEPHTAKGYQSDFDLLVIVNQKELTDRIAYWEKAEERLNRERAISRTLKTPVNFIVHSLQEVNDGLAHGRFFFMDVARDGIALYQAEDSELHRPRPKSPQEAYQAAQDYFDDWFPDAMRRFELAKVAIERGFSKQAAFDLHQTTEALYHCVLLVSTFYTPHVHNLAFLRTQAERASPRLFTAWPRSTRAERALFEKLKSAYVKARYSKHFRITSEELQWIASHVEELGRLVHSDCAERLEAMKAVV